MYADAIRFPDIPNPQFCSLQHTKHKKSEDYVQSKGFLGLRYSTSMHYAIAHLSRADSAQPAHSSLKEGDGFARFIYDCCRGIYFLLQTQPVYCWWFYYIWTNVIGPTLKALHPKISVKTASDVDALLDCQVRTYVLAYF